MPDYSCPACGAPADLTAGCSACHRPPDPAAARVTELNSTIADLGRRVEQARLRYGEMVERLNATIRERNELALRIPARAVPVLPSGWAPPALPFLWAPPVPPAPAAPRSTAPVPARPESSGKTVQNILFILGGLLLGSAAIVFTAVAWANFGVLGRAVVLGLVTVLTLAVPPPTRRRRLHGTAETFGALGLLLVLLDGYAAWASNLANLTSALPATRYAGLVCLATAAIAAAYAAGTRLTGPRFAVLLLAQPVPILVLDGFGLGAAGWAATLSLLALVDLAVVRWIRRPRAIPVLAWAFAGLWAGTAALYALFAILVGDDLPGAARAAAALLLVTLLLVPAALNAPRLAWLRHLAAAVVAVGLFLAVGRVLSVALPGLRLAPLAVEVVVLALIVRFLPGAIRRGARIGVLIAAGFVAIVPAVLAIIAGAFTVGAAWGWDFVGTNGSVDWPMPVALALAAAAFALLLPGRARVPAVVVGAALLALLLPRSAPLTWWAPSIVDGVVAVPLALLASRARTGGRAALYGGAAAILVSHAVAVGLGRPAVEAAVLTALLALATVVAATGRRTVVGALATGVALLVPAGLGAALASAAGRETQPFAAAGLVVSTAAVLALYRRLGGYATTAALAVPVAGLGVAVASLYSGWYVGVPVLCDVLVAVAVLPGLRREHREWYLPMHLVLSAPALLVPLVTVLPATWALLVAPYAWLSAIWSGRPAGTGLVPPDATVLLPGGPVFGLGPAAATLALLALSFFALRRHVVRAGLWGAGPACLAILAGAVALGAPWPTVAAVSLAIGVGAALLGALRPMPSRTAPPMLAMAAPAIGAGLAGTLATKASTLTGLVIVLVTATVCAVSGRGLGARVTGWLVAVPTGVLLAYTAARALDVSTPAIAFWVLAAAAVALGVSIFPRTAGEQRAVEAAAHASAAAALLLTAGIIGYAAMVLALWGIALGLRALLPGDLTAEPGHAVAARRARIVAALVCELVAYWLLLWTGGVGLVEAYTVPAAGATLVAGWLAARSRPGLHSWTAYGPALVAGFGPSLALVLTVPGEPLRRLALGLAALAVVVAGAVRRRQAPVVIGGATLVLIALHEAVLLWDLLPRWIPLGTAGLVLVGLAITYERRRRDVTRLREAVGGMG